MTDHHLGAREEGGKPSYTQAQVMAFARHGTALEEIARAIHDAEWEERFDELPPNGIARAMAMKQAVAVMHVLMRWCGVPLS